MNLKKSLIAATLAASAIATPALADLRVNVGIGAPPPVYRVAPAPVYAVPPGYWAWNGRRYVWVRGYREHRHAHWRSPPYAYGHYR